MAPLDEKSKKLVKALIRQNTSVALKLLDDKDIQENINVTVEKYSISPKPFTYLCFASACSGEEVVQKRFTIPGIEKENHLLHACYKNKHNIMKALLESGVIFDKYKKKLVTLVLQGHTETLEVILDKFPELINESLNANTNVSSSNFDILTLLHLAAFGGYMNMVKLLINKGANMHPTHKGQTPYDIAVQRNHTDIAAYLKDKMKANERMQTTNPVHDRELVYRVSSLEIQCNQQKTEIDDLKRENLSLKQRVSDIETVVKPRIKCNQNGSIKPEQRFLVDRVRENFELLLENILVEDHMDFLYQEKALSLDDCQIIESQQSDKRKTRALLQRLLRQKSGDWVTVFKTSLGRCGGTKHLLEIFN